MMMINKEKRNKKQRMNGFIDKREKEDGKQEINMYYEELFAFYDNNDCNVDDYDNLLICMYC